MIRNNVNADVVFGSIRNRVQSVFFVGFFGPVAGMIIVIYLKQRIIFGMRFYLKEF